jgi:microcystin-dependent protein
LVPISENEALFALIGTTYGGDGQSTFALPDLRSRVPIHFGTAAGGTPRVLAETGGVEQVTLTANQIPSHTHPLLASTAPGAQSNPAGSVPAQSPSVTMYLEEAPTVALNAGAVTPVGGSQPHTNVQPFLCLNYIISLFGIFPSPS